jgi:hypothetical protein
VSLIHVQCKIWDNSHLIAAQVKQQLQQFHGNEPNCCEDRGHLWDMAAVYPPNIKWGEAGPIFDDGPVYRIAPQLSERLTQISNRPSAAASAR